MCSCTYQYYSSVVDLNKYRAGSDENKRTIRYLTYFNDMRGTWYILISEGYILYQVYRLQYYSTWYQAQRYTKYRSSIWSAMSMLMCKIEPLPKDSSCRLLLYRIPVSRKITQPLGRISFPSRFFLQAQGGTHNQNDIPGI